MSKIKKLTIENSKFYNDPVEINFSSKLNCIMGGRGTGKTTLLWLIDSALHPEVESDKSVFGLLSSNLGNGKIKVTLEDTDGETFEIEKVLGEKPIVYNSTRAVVDFDDFSENIVVDFYESSQIEKIGQSPEERLSLIDKHLEKDIKNARKLEPQIFSQLGQNKAIISDLLLKKRELQQILEPLAEAENEFKEFEKQKPDGDEEAAKQFTQESENQKNREFELQFKNEVAQTLKTIQFQIANLVTEIDDFSARVDKFSPVLNRDVVEKIKLTLKPLLAKAKDSFQSGGKDIESSMTASTEFGDGLVKMHKDQELVFSQLRQKFEKNREYFQKLNMLSKKVTAKEVAIKDLQTATEKLSLAIEVRKELLANLKSVHRKIFEIRLAKIEEINKELNGDVKITLKESGIVGEFERQLKDSLKGKGFNYKDESEKISQKIKPSDFALLVLTENHECLASSIGISVDKAKAIIDSLSKTQDLFLFETTYCADMPTFFLKVDRKDDTASQSKDNYRETESLSTGQRCTAILPIIFAASSNPLVIDQPEDNLDNKYIADSIHKIIKAKKDTRQMIFVTHNPNIPVLSGAEYNLFLDYKGKKSKVDAFGTIDAVKQNILTLLEGGEVAFKLRKDIYGF